MLLRCFARHDFERVHTLAALVVVAGLVPDEANHKGILGHSEAGSLPRYFVKKIRVHAVGNHRNRRFRTLLLNL